VTMREAKLESGIGDRSHDIERRTQGKMICFDNQSLVFAVIITRKLSRDRLYPNNQKKSSRQSHKKRKSRNPKPTPVMINRKRCQAGLVSCAKTIRRRNSFHPSLLFLYFPICAWRKCRGVSYPVPATAQLFFVIAW
jgi:hypothetical protein